MIQTITSRDNSLIKHAKKLMNSPRYRREQRQFVVEGMRLCLDAVASQVTIQRSEERRVGKECRY